MELLIPHTCKVCGLTDEAQIRYAGPHLKQSCHHCGTYVKFFSKLLMPDHQEIKLKIWAITQDTSEIEAAKEMCGFVEGLKGLDQKIMYWRLYLYLRDYYTKFSIGDGVVTHDGEIAIVRNCSYTGFCTVSIVDEFGGHGDEFVLINANKLKYIHALNIGGRND